MLVTSERKNLNASVKGAVVERGTSSSCPQKFGEGCIQSIILSKRVIELHWTNLVNAVSSIECIAVLIDLILKRA